MTPDEPPWIVLPVARAASPALDAAAWSGLALGLGCLVAARTGPAGFVGLAAATAVGGWLPTLLDGRTARWCLQARREGLLVQRDHARGQVEGWLIPWALDPRLERGSGPDPAPFAPPGDVAWRIRCDEGVIELGDVDPPPDLELSAPAVTELVALQHLVAPLWWRVLGRLGQRPPEAVADELPAVRFAIGSLLGTFAILAGFTDRDPGDDAARALVGLALHVGLFVALALASWAFRPSPGSWPHRMTYPVVYSALMVALADGGWLPEVAAGAFLVAHAPALLATPFSTLSAPGSAPAGPRPRATP